MNIVGGMSFSTGSATECRCKMFLGSVGLAIFSACHCIFTLLAGLKLVGFHVTAACVICVEAAIS